MKLGGIFGRELRDLYAEARDAGCTLTLTKKNHVRIDTPGGPVFGPGTSRSHTAIKNLRAQLRRNGVDL